MNKQQALERLTSLENEAKELRKIIEEPEIIKPTKEQRFWSLINGITLRVDLDKYSSSIFFFKDDSCVIEYNTKSGYLWLSYKDIWSIFEKEYHLKYDEVRSFIKNQVEEHFKCKGVTPKFYDTFNYTWVEEHFKCK
jgi:hypothetical protein